MLSINQYANNSAEFKFKFTTSDGDKIEINLEDSLEVESNFSKSRNSISEEFTLRHKFGYEFKYEGNGLSKEDLKEIKEAFKKVKPLLEKFLKEKEANEKVINNVAHSIKSLLPTPKDENHLNAIKNEAVNTFDDVLKSIKATLEELNKAKELFDKLFDNHNKLDIFG